MSEKKYICTVPHKIDKKGGGFKAFEKGVKYSLDEIEAAGSTLKFFKEEVESDLNGGQQGNKKNNKKEDDKGGNKK
ncbi:MAG: hypothetical protein KAS32_30470 [Candidatus Peribacteraceae bacterium]|nr:hypothetical protein [Candidatus Peribacteraceae bacterium]